AWSPEIERKKNSEQVATPASSSSDSKMNYVSMSKNSTSDSGSGSQERKEDMTKTPEVKILHLTALLVLTEESFKGMYNGAQLFRLP
ncbi:unnamed protein product, partial [Amoebophrya sp. A25]